MTRTPSNSTWMTSRAICDPCSTKPQHAVSVDGKHTITQPQYVTSHGSAFFHRQPAGMHPETTPKNKLTIIQGSSSEDTWVLPFCDCTSNGGGPWNAHEKDVGASSQLGCPANCHGSQSVEFWETPHGSNNRTSGAKPSATAPLNSHVSTGCVGGCQRMWL